MFKVNEYIRTNEGNIYKYNENNENNEKVFIDNFEEMLNVVKHSKNIIDLIEVDDIVKVLDMDWIRILKLDNEEEIEMFKEELEENNYKLLSIVTKEQFADIEYKVNT